ncbi:MAG: imidazole glycerol phosphate synthase subunit HisF [Bacteroidia bacterium]|nr:imidazole glycerol phosphate synthase subunit HisF [Bacteroidia bacterium]MCC6767925.1 imidazole glycerol phosphate synthase subunit HisF [Bacteroidia bacterium]
MPLAKRIIPCLDIKDGQTVKGVNFVDLKTIGDPVELAARYAEEGADELVLLDIMATHEGRKTFAALVKRVAKELNIPFTVGGGISAPADVGLLLEAGADKVSVNSAAFRSPSLLSDLASLFGRQCIVLAVDVRLDEQGWQVYLNGGRMPTGKPCIDWVLEGVERGAGEVLLTSMSHDGTRDGFAIELTSQVSSAVNVPVIASGGAGNLQHFADVFQAGQADAALAASVFHSGEIPIQQLKTFLRNQSIHIR